MDDHAHARYVWMCYSCCSYEDVGQIWPLPGFSETAKDGVIDRKALTWLEFLQYIEESIGISFFECCRAEDTASTIPLRTLARLLYLMGNHPFHEQGVVTTDRAHDYMHGVESQWTDAGEEVVDECSGRHRDR